MPGSLFELVCFWWLETTFVGLVCQRWPCGRTLLPKASCLCSVAGKLTGRQRNVLDMPAKIIPRFWRVDSDFCRRAREFLRITSDFPGKCEEFPVLRGGQRGDSIAVLMPVYDVLQLNLGNLAKKFFCGTEKYRMSPIYPSVVNLFNHERQPSRQWNFRILLQNTHRNMKPVSRR